MIPKTYLILVSPNQAVANQIKTLVSEIPDQPYQVEWAFNAANLNHFLHQKNMALILLDGTGHRLTEFAMVLRQHTRGSDVPIAALNSDDTPFSLSKINIHHQISLNEITAAKFHQEIKQIALNVVVDSTAESDSGSTQSTADSPWQSVSIQEFFSQCLTHVETATKEKEITVFTTYDDGPSSMIVNVPQLQLITKALLTNAVEQTPAKGAVGLEVVGDKGHETLHITIWDTGSGHISKHLLQTSSTNEAHDLSRAVQAIYQHEGTVSTRGVPGRGSNVTVSIPWFTNVPQEIKAPFTVKDQAPRIMVVEDNLVNAETVANYLHKKGFQVLRAENGQEALEQITTFRPDLILMDVHMPVMDGLEATRRIRDHTDPAIVKTPIIALTALSMSSDRKDCFEAGADDYISKPVSLRWLVQSIRMQLEKNR